VEVQRGRSITLLWMLWVWWHTAGVAVLYAGKRQNRQVLQHEDGYMASRHTQRAAYIHMYIWGVGWVPLGMQRVYMVLDIAAGTRSVLCARLAQLKTDTIFCLTALHTVTYVSSIATFFIRLHLQ